MQPVITFKMTILFSLIMSLAFGFLPPAHSAADTKDQIIDKVWLAMFGKAKGRLNDPNGDEVQTLYIESYFGDGEVENKYSIRRPNLFRNEFTEGTLVFDGKKAAWVKRQPDKEGNPQKPELIVEQSWRHFEVDIARLFPAFFDYQAELKGIKKVKDRSAYEIYVELPLGSNVTYFVDTETFLIIKELVSWEGNPEQKLWANWIDNYIDYDGLLYPEGFSFKGEKEDVFGHYVNVKFNVDFKDELFEIPSDLKPPKK